MEQMLAGLSTRRYHVGLEPIGEQVAEKVTSTGKSAISRRFVRATEHALADPMNADPSGLDLVAFMVDGVHLADHVCVVALGVTIDGVKVPLAIEEGSTENASLVTSLIVGLRERGLDVTRPVPTVGRVQKTNPGGRPACARACPRPSPCCAWASRPPRPGR